MQDVEGTVLEAGDAPHIEEEEKEEEDDDDNDDDEGSEATRSTSATLSSDRGSALCTL